MPTQRLQLLSAARRFLGSRADAEDAVQDSLVRAFETYSDWQTREPAWMHVVLRNIAIDKQRRRTLESAHEHAVSMAEASWNTMPSPVRSWELAAECEAGLRHLLGRASAMEAAAILLRDVFEFEYREIADMLRRSEEATRQILHRARLRARAPDVQHEVDDAYLGLCCRAMELREPALVMEMLQGTTAQMAGRPGVFAREPTGGETRLVRINGRYALALVLDGVVLCVIPVGSSSSANMSTVPSEDPA